MSNCFLDTTTPVMVSIDFLLQRYVVYQVLLKVLQQDLIIFQTSFHKFPLFYLHLVESLKTRIIEHTITLKKSLTTQQVSILKEEMDKDGVHLYYTQTGLNHESHYSPYIMHALCEETLMRLLSLPYDEALTKSFHTIR